MRLIDANELLEHVGRDKLDTRELIMQMVMNAPTVKLKPYSNIEVLADALPKHRLIVDPKDPFGDYHVYYESSWISDPPMLRGEYGQYGRGKTVNDAAIDYIQKITGKKLVFGYGKNREEVIVAFFEVSKNGQ